MPSSGNGEASLVSQSRILSELFVHSFEVSEWNLRMLGSFSGVIGARVSDRFRPCLGVSFIS
jgi:hypothetical protein